VDGGADKVVAKHSDAPNWSPDGNLLLFTSYTDAPIGDNNRSYLQIFDLRTGTTSVVPSSQGTLGGVWITQDTLVATPYNPTKFLTFDFRTQKWTDLATGHFTSWAVSPDGRYLYFSTGGASPEAQRLRFSDRQTETIASLKDLRRVVDVFDGTQIDIAPDGSPVFARDIGSQEIYALNVRWP
jgi:Tol biopolymer transport system component